jgi:hypothetical protein
MYNNFDLIASLFLIIVLFLICKYENKLIKIVSVILYFFIFPMYSMDLEFLRAEKENFICFDSFTMLYTFLKFPIYIFQISMVFLIYEIYKWKINKNNL